MSSLFLRLEKVTVIPILTEWVEIFDLAYLDSAACNSDDRSILLGLFACESFTHNGTLWNASNGYFEWLADRQVKIRNLNLVPFSNIPLSKALCNVFQRQTSIKHLQINYGSTLNIIISSYCKNIESLCFKESYEMLDEELAELLERIEGLVKLNISDCENLSNITAVKIAEHCPNLQSIRFSYCGDTTAQFITTIAQNCHDLTELHTSENVTEKALLEVAKNCPKLTSLIIEYGRDITDTSLLAVIEACPGLTCLHISDCRHVTDTPLHRLAESCPNLTELTVNNCPNVKDPGLTAVLSRCHDLVGVNLYSLRIGDDILLTLAHNCPRLQRLHIGGHSCSATDVSIVRIAKSCRHLKEVVFTECRRISDFALMQLYEHCHALAGVRTISSPFTDVHTMHVARDVGYLDLHGMGVEERGWDDDDSDQSGTSSSSSSDSDSEVDSLLGDDAPELGSANEYDSEEDEDFEEEEEFYMNGGEDDDEDGGGGGGVGTLFDTLFGAGAGAIIDGAGGAGGAGGGGDGDGDDDSEESYVMSENGRQSAPLNSTLDSIKREEQDVRCGVEDQYNHLSTVITRPTPRHPLFKLTHRYSQLKNASLAVIAGNCPSLQVLKIVHYKSHLDDDTVELVLQRCGGTLHTVCIERCTQLTASAYVSIARQCPLLQRLEINGADKLTDDAASKIIFYRGDAIQHLSLEKCANLGDTSITKLSECTQLKSLNLSRLSQITDSSVIQIAKHCTSLTALDISGCLKLTAKCLASLAALPALRSLDVRYCPEMKQSLEGNKWAAKMKKTYSMEFKH